MYYREYRLLYYKNVTSRKNKGLAPIPREQWYTPPRPHRERSTFTVNGLRDLYVPVIKTYWLEHHYAPNIRAVQELTGISSTSVVNSHLRRLKTAGYVLFEDTLAGTIRLPNMRISFDETMGSNSAA